MGRLGKLEKALERCRVQTERLNLSNESQVDLEKRIEALFKANKKASERLEILERNSAQIEDAYKDMNERLRKLEDFSE